MAISSKFVLGQFILHGSQPVNKHPEIIKKPEDVVDAYANKHPRRLQLL